METIISACGLVCTKCDAYQATKANDQERLEGIAKDWSAQYGITGLTIEQVRCNGCMTEGEPKCDHCGQHCGIRKCAVSKGVSTCGQCVDFPCEELTGFYTRVGQPAGENMKHLLMAIRAVEHRP
jgi:hypothetical protein